jgi:predicted nucleic acid-binding protein
VQLGQDTAPKTKIQKTMPRYPNNLLVDSGFWFAYYEPKDKYFKEAQRKVDLLDRANILLPWPTLYETLNTRFVRHSEYLRHFERIARRPNVELIDDTPYRAGAYELALNIVSQSKRPLSLTDMIIRLVIESTNVQVHYLLTFNPGDFSDICRKRSVALV